MTTRYSGYVITLEEDIREDDAEELTKLLQMIRGIISVEPVEGLGMDIQIAKSRIRHELGQKLFKVLQES